MSKAYKLDDGTIGEILNAENADEKSVISKILELDTRLVIGKETAWGVKPLATAGKLTRRTTVTLDLARALS